MGVVPCVQRATRKIELLTLDVDDSVLVHRLERAVVKAAVAPGIEAPLLLPTQLLDLISRRRAVVEELLKRGEFVGCGLPDIVAGCLDTSLEIRERHELALVQLHHRLLHLDIPQREDSPCVLLVPDVQDRSHREVAPPHIVPGS